MSDERPHILVVDDEPPIVDLVSGYLAREGWRVSSEGDGLRALETIRATAPDVVVLDVMLPGLDGIEVCRRMRTFSDAYVLMLTARGEEIDRIMGLTVGADDYLVKPFSPRELVARVKVLLRRPRGADPAGTLPAGTLSPDVPGGVSTSGVAASSAAASGVSAAGTSVGAASASRPPGLELDEARHTVRVDGEPVELTVLEFNLLATLARDPGIVVGRQALLDRVWGPEFVGDDHLVDVHVANLRRKLRDEPARPRFVETVRGVGYRLREPS